MAFIGVPIAEIAVFIQLGGWLGLGPTLALIILTAVIGTWMLRHQGMRVLARAQQSLADGRMPVGEVFEGVCLLLAGAFLLTPGFLTDGLGALLLVPAVRRFLFQQVRRRLEPMAAGPADVDADGTTQTFEAVFEEIDPDPVKPDQDRRKPPDVRPDPTMPPPRGGWDRHS